MRVLIYEPDKKVQSMISNLMINQDIIPHIETNRTELFNLLLSRKYDIFLADYSDPDFINDIVFNVKLNKELLYIKFYIAIEQSERQIVLNLIKLGISGFIKKPFSQEQFAPRFGKWIQENTFRNEKRIHIRIVPPPTDNAFALIKSKHYPIELNCQIINISAGGIAVYIPPKYQDKINDLFIVDDKIKNISLRIRRIHIIVDLKLINIKDLQLGFQFINIDEQSHKYIYRYLAENLN